MSINLNSSNLHLNSDKITYKQNVKSFQRKYELNKTQSDILDIKKDASNDGKFTIGQALKNFGKGLLSPIKAVIEHPLLTIGAIGLTGAAITAVPALGPLMLIGFGGYSLFELSKGIYNASSAYSNGEYDNAEKSFQTIGSGTIGTLLTLLGVKSSAKTVSELKYADKIKTQLTMYDKQVLSELNKNQTFISALKENFSLLTTKEGRSALVNSLKPKNIKEKFIALKEAATNNQEAIIKRFRQSTEGQRRINIPSSQLKKDTINMINKAFDEAGIPAEARPKIIISDDIRCMTPKEANTTLTKILRKQSFNKELNANIFKKGESLKDLTIEELSARLTKFANENSIKLDNKSIEYIANDLLSGLDTTAGAYNAAEHTLSINLKTYRNGLLSSIENVALHETLHARMAILRNSLSPDEISNIIKESLINRIKNGEPQQIIKAGSIFGPDMINAPKMDNKMRQSFINFAEKYLYRKNKEITSFLAQRNELSSKLRSVIKENKTEEIAKITQQLNNLNSKYSKLNDEITMLVKNNPEFIKTNGGTEEKALSVLFDYITSHDTRYNHFASPQTNIKRNITLSPEQKQQAIDSLKNYIDTIEGNCAISQNFGLFRTQNDFNQYQFSYEELLARNTAAKEELANLRNILAKDTITAEEKANLAVKIKHIETELKYNEIGEKYYNLHQKLLKSPDDKKLITELSQIQKEFNKISKNKKLNSNLSYLVVDMNSNDKIPTIMPTFIINDANKK